MTIIKKTIMTISIFLIFVLLVSCDISNTQEDTTNETSTILTTEGAIYPVELDELYDLDLYDVSLTEVNDGTINRIYTLTSKEDSSMEALIYEVEADGYVDNITMLIAINKDYTVEGYYVIEHNESSGFGAEIVSNDFGLSTITDLSGFDSVSGVTYTSLAIEECFLSVQERVEDDFS